MSTTTRNAVRIGDEQRREVAEALGQHLADGRLRLIEYEERLDRVYAATTESELATVTEDLPAVQTSRDRRRRQRIASGILLNWAGIAVLMLAIWAFTGAGYFWPVWPIMGTGIGMIPSAVAIWRGRADPARSPQCTPITGGISRRHDRSDAWRRPAGDGRG